MKRELDKLFSPSALLIAGYCLVANDNAMYDFIFLLPLTYSISYFVFSYYISLKGNYGLNLVYVISQALIYIRYVLTPFFTVFSAYFTSWGWGPDPSYEQMLLAEILMCIEMVCIFIIQYFAIRKYSQKKYLHEKQSVEYEENYGVLVLYAIFAAVLVLIMQPSLLIMDNYFIYTGIERTNRISNAGMYVILADTFKKVFLIIILIICKKGYDRHPNKVYLLLAVVAVALNMALNTGGTRIRMVFSLILGAYFLVFIFGKIPKIFYIAGFLGCIISFLSVSLLKFSYAMGRTSSPVLAVISIMLGQFQDYFAGPRLVGQMINLSRVYGDYIGISTFINDFMGSVPIISNYIDQSNRINYYFNIYCNIQNQTLIAPILGIGFCYFPVFPFFFSIFFEYMAVKLDYLMSSTSKISYKYLYAYMGYLCAMCMGYSTQNIYAQFVSAFIPLFILFKVNDKIRINRC